MFGWFKSERRERRKKVRQDRKQLEARARRFLKSYLEADEVRKPEFYRAVEDISNKCRPPDLDFSQPDLNDGQIAEATSKAAMRENRRVGDSSLHLLRSWSLRQTRRGSLVEVIWRRAPQGSTKPTQTCKS